ncbi:MAG: adenosylcobinamide-GDP ribazoletransferase, partial [Pseudomonadota bacterium]
MLTILPFFRLYEFTKGCNGYAVAYYPLVGLILGAVIYLINILLAPFLPHNFLISFLFFLYILLYGALHLDGFTDSVDG